MRFFERLKGRLYLGGEQSLREEWPAFLQRPSTTVIFTPNPEQVVMAHADTSFAKQLLQADILLPDGSGLVAAMRWLFPSLRSRLGRITGTDTLEWWLEAAAREGVSTFLLGGQSGVAQKLARQADPTKSWCDGAAGYARVDAPAPEEEKEILEKIAAWRPQVLWVAFGAPHQERWVLAHRTALQEIGVKVVVVCGGAYNYLVGDVSRAPRVIRRFGLEWLYRLFSEPWRWRRQRRLPIFLGLVAREMLLRFTAQAR